MKKYICFLVLLFVTTAVCRAEDREIVGYVNEAHTGKQLFKVTLALPECERQGDPTVLSYLLGELDRLQTENAALRKTIGEASESK